MEERRRIVLLCLGRHTLPSEACRWAYRGVLGTQSNICSQATPAPLIKSAKVPVTYPRGATEFGSESCVSVSGIRMRRCFSASTAADPSARSSHVSPPAGRAAALSSGPPSRFCGRRRCTGWTSTGVRQPLRSLCFCAPVSSGSAEFTSDPALMPFKPPINRVGA